MKNEITQIKHNMGIKAAPDRALACKGPATAGIPSNNKGGMPAKIMI
ncbi:MAG: hypothetical protein LBQ60_13780 [Bacteroidales bacterium]|nr:hypothetical protein [Bacteroidales bacterium]